ncbi:MAG: MBL fold metallo-hydrolase [Bacillota bacterium]
MTRKRFLLLLLVALLSTFSFSGCGGDESNTTSQVNSVESSHGLTGDLKVTFLDVGQGDSIFLELPNRQTMLIDAGNPDDAVYVSQYIRTAGYKKIDYVVATHPHDDHIGGMPEIIKDFDIGSIYMPKVSNNTASFENLLAEIEHKGYKINTAKAGVSILNDDSLTINIIAPVKSFYDDLNNYSAVIRLDYGSTSYLFMGDAEKLSENQIKADVDADVLKVGHHGSNYSSSSSFIKRVSPEYTVISVGQGNSYGHPSRETLDTLSANQAAIYRTDEQGSIIIKSDGSKITSEKAPAVPSITPETPNYPDSGADSIVYITNTGSKYHRDGCQYLSRSKIPISLSEAVIHYDPCTVCDPPIVDSYLTPPEGDNLPAQ